MRISSGAIADADVTDRITRDVGYVADRWLREIRAGRAFARGIDLTSGVGNIAHVQLLNPAGSGITIIVHEVIVALGVIDTLSLMTHNTAETLVGTGFNLLAGGAAAVGGIRTRDGTAVGTNLLARIMLLANTPYAIVSGWHIELGAGEGVVARMITTNATLAASFLWMEL